MEILDVKCRHFERTFNCSSTSLPKDIRDACCTGDPNMESSRQFYFSTLMKCCEVLEDNGFGRTDNQDWENGSYQAYVMGVAVFAILICLFVSGARSIRRRRTLMRARLHQQMNGTDPVNLPQINTQISLGPPTYGELEASGLTTDYKMGLFDPPAYPGTPGDQEEHIAPTGDQRRDQVIIPPDSRGPKSDAISLQDETIHKGESSDSFDVEPRCLDSSHRDLSSLQRK